MRLNRFIQYTVIVLLFGYYIACAPVNFKKDATIKCQKSELDCVTVNNVDLFEIDYTSLGGAVDILFIDDNSGSMSFEQKKIAKRFDSFLKKLGEKTTDYRIGIVTTDISNNNASSALYNPSRSINKDGALQDGELIKFSDGSSYLTSSSSSEDNQSLFSETIERGETQTCEDYQTANADKSSVSSSDWAQGNYDNCPSGDERGIYAANLVVKQNPESFLRTNAHLAVVILADEDVRSSNYSASQNYKLSDDDLPQSLIDNVKSTYGSKTLSVHSIIIKPGDLIDDQTAESVASLIGEVGSKGLNGNPSKYFKANGADSSCLKEQSNQLNVKNSTRRVRGSYGYIYYLASKMTDGIVGDICAQDGDYTSQLEDIGSNISNRLSEIQLACADPKDLKVVLPTAYSSVTYEVEGSILKFSEILPVNTKVTGSYGCSTLEK